MMAYIKWGFPGGSDGKASLIIREMQIKTTMRFHPRPVRMAAIKKSTNNAVEGAEKKEPSYTVVGMQTSTATMENCVAIP